MAKTNVSGHSGLPEHIELQMMADKAQQVADRKEEQRKRILDLMNEMGIAPHERKTFIISFAKWMLDK